MVEQKSGHTNDGCQRSPKFSWMLNRRKSGENQGSQGYEQGGGRDERANVRTFPDSLFVTLFDPLLSTCPRRKNREVLASTRGTLFKMDKSKLPSFWNPTEHPELHWSFSGNPSFFSLATSADGHALSSQLPVAAWVCTAGSASVASWAQRCRGARHEVTTDPRVPKRMARTQLGG